MCHIATNAQIVERALDHWNQTGEPLWDVYAGDLVYVTRPEITGEVEYRGHDGFREALADFRRVWAEMRPHVFEVNEVREDVMVVGMRWHLRGHSGVQLEVDEYFATWTRNGEIARMQQYGTREEAVAACD